MDLILFGIQGSGKGTQAKKLAADRGYHIFEAGAELRNIAATGSELGNTVKSFIDDGNLVPHKIIMQVVKEAIGKVPVTQPIIFDGIPRDDNQKNDFDVIMTEAGRPFRAIHILLPKDEAVARIIQRAKHQGRADDAREETILRRMQTFLDKTMPVIEAYKQAGLVAEIDGNADVETVYSRLKEAIK